MRIRVLDDAAMAAWLEGRPQIIHDLARSHPPGVLFRLVTTGQLVEVMSYGENGHLRVWVDPEWNPAQFLVGLQVFGILPEELVPATPQDVKDWTGKWPVFQGTFEVN